MPIFYEVTNKEITKREVANVPNMKSPLGPLPFKRACRVILKKAS
jgi:hypothetical protein